VRKDMPKTGAYQHQNPDFYSFELKNEHNTSLKPWKINVSGIF